MAWAALVVVLLPCFYEFSRRRSLIRFGYRNHLDLNGLLSARLELDRGRAAFEWPDEIRILICSWRNVFERHQPVIAGLQGTEGNASGFIRRAGSCGLP